MVRFLRIMIALIMATVAIGCGGGGGTTTPALVGTLQTPPPSARFNREVSFLIDVPKATANGSARKKKPQQTDNVYVSPLVGSVGFQLTALNGAPLGVNSPAPLLIDVTPANCNTAAGIGNACQVAVAGVPAATGTDRFTITTYAGSQGSGAVVSIGIVDVVVDVSGKSAPGTIGDPTHLTVGGGAARLTLQFEPAAFVAGTASQSNVIVTAQDAAGATLIGNTQFATPVSVSTSDAHLTLQYGSSQNDSSVLSIANNVATFTKPETSSALLSIAYDGLSGVGSVFASARDALGHVVTTGAVPIPFGPAPAPPPGVAPQDLYVLNAADNTVFEYSVPVPPDRQPIRGFGGLSAIPCPPVGGADLPYFSGAVGITADTVAPGNVYIGSDQACASNPGALYAFGAGAVGGSAVPSITSPYGGGTAARLTYDLPQHAVGAAFLINQNAFYGAGYSEFVSGTGSPTLALSVFPPGSPCVVPVTSVQSGIDPCASSTQFGFSFPSFIVVSDPAGNRYYVGYFPGSNNEYVIAPFAPGQTNNGDAIIIAGSWIEPAATDPFINVGVPLAAATDGKMIYVLATNATGNQYQAGIGPGLCNPYPGSTINVCSDGVSHVFILGFDLSQLGSPGAVDVQPSLVLGGSKVARFAPQAVFNFGGAPLQADMLALYNGKLYVANPSGPTCSADCQAALQAGGANEYVGGEVDVYDATLRGTHVDDPQSAPVSVISGPFVRTPIGVTTGLPGTQRGGLMGLERRPASVRAVPRRPLWLTSKPHH